MAISTIHPLTGWVSRISRVPSRCSSAISRIVEAATKNVSIQGIIVKSGRNDASLVRWASLKKKNDTATANTTRRMYPVGWSK